MNDQIILAALALAWFVVAMAVAFELARVVARIRAKSIWGVKTQN